jgi:hypothetical protein
MVFSDKFIVEVLASATAKDMFGDDEEEEEEEGRDFGAESLPSLLWVVSPVVRASCLSDSVLPGPAVTKSKMTLRSNQYSDRV